MDKETEYSSDDDYSDDDLFDTEDEDTDEDIKSADQLTKEEKRFIGLSNSSSISRIYKDYLQIIKTDLSQFIVIQMNENNIHHWNITLSFDSTEIIQQELVKYMNIEGNSKHPAGIQMGITFPGNYPMSPPFVRVISPRFKFRTGRITCGGSICMELLTKSGWSPIYSFGTALIQIQAEILDGNPSIDFNNRNPYSEDEAKKSFIRIAKEKNWE